MNKATHWLQDPSRNYQDGVTIYKEVYGMDKQYAFFANASNPQPGGLHFNLLTEKIKVAERRIANALPDTDEPLTPSPTIRVAPIKFEKGVRIVDNNLVDVTMLPPELQQKFFRNKDLMKELAGEHAAMKSASTDAIRAVHFENCKALEWEKDTNWKEIDSWWKLNDHKKNTTITNAIPEVNIEKRMETVRKAILRVKKELKDTTMDLKKVKSKKAKLEAWEKEMADLKTKKLPL